MSKSVRRRTRLQKAIDGCKVIFCRTESEDVETVMPEDHENNEDKKGEINNKKDKLDGNEDQTPDDKPKIDAGLRSPRWYERIDQRTEENRKRSIQNKNLLQRVDYRTVWIARLLIAMLAGILGTVVIEALLL